MDTMPALFTRTSSWPCSASTASTTLVQSASRVTSWWWYVARSPMDAAVCFPSSSSTSVMTTAAPSSAKSSASRAPCPRAPPVIRATLLSSRPMGRTLQERCRALRLLVGHLEQHAVEDEELRHPEHTEPEHVAEVRQDRTVGVAVFQEDHEDRREQQAEEGHDPERDDLGVDAALATLLPDPRTAEVVRGHGADRDGGDVGPPPRPAEDVCEEEDEALAHDDPDHGRQRVLPELLDERPLIQLLQPLGT